MADLRDTVWSILMLLTGRTAPAPLAADATLPAHYRPEHALYVDGIEKIELPASLEPDAVVLLANLEPNSALAQPGLLLSAPHGLYPQIARLAQRKWGSQADIAFAYDILPDSGPAQTAPGAAMDRLFPTLTIRALS
jgi:hypothetical protein